MTTLNFPVQQGFFFTTSVTEHFPTAASTISRLFQAYQAKRVIKITVPILQHNDTASHQPLRTTTDHSSSEQLTQHPRPNTSSSPKDAPSRHPRHVQTTQGRYNTATPGSRRKEATPKLGLRGGTPGDKPGSQHKEPPQT